MKNTLQTLDRGLHALDLISQSDKGLTVSQLATSLEISRPIAYRIATTLENHGYIYRGQSGYLRLGTAAVLLSHRFQPQIRTIARPFLAQLANATQATAFISMAQGTSCSAILVEEPTQGILQVSYRVGSSHPLTKGAAGIAILSSRPPSKQDSEAVLLAREHGYSVSRGELQPGAIGVAAPLKSAIDGALPECSLGVVALTDLNVELAIQQVQAIARQLLDELTQ